MTQLFCKLPCQSVSKSYRNREIYEELFDKRVDKRYLESAVQRFINLNKRMFSFLGIEVELNGTDNDLSLVFRTTNFIGAIPVKMPYDGIAHKDFQVMPRFDNSKEVYSELTQLLSRLEYSIMPEHSALDLLNSPMQLQPPIYYEALRYIELFEKSYDYCWVKFDSKNRIHPFPKSSTDWSKYTVTSFDPMKTLVFPSRDSVLSTNHIEWKKLKYVFEIAKEQVTDSVVPSSIRIRYFERIRNISRKVSDVNSMPTDEMIIRAGDPQCIKDLKVQANIILRKSSNNCSAWRMDMALLFERYVQSIVGRAAKALKGTVVSNAKIFGTGNIPTWGLRYLEPDIVIRIGANLYMCDAKYKANFYSLSSESSVIKDVHRADLHQLLAYSSFEPQSSKVCILFYPASKLSFLPIAYKERLVNVRNKVLLCGIPFGVTELDNVPFELKEFLQDELINV